MYIIFCLFARGIRAPRHALRAVLWMWHSGSWLRWMLVEIMMNTVSMRRVANHRLRPVRNLNGRAFIVCSGKSWNSYKILITLILALVDFRWENDYCILARDTNNGRSWLYCFLDRTMEVSICCDQYGILMVGSISFVPGSGECRSVDWSYMRVQDKQQSRKLYALQIWHPVLFAEGE